MGRREGGGGRGGGGEDDLLDGRRGVKSVMREGVT